MRRQFPRIRGLEFIPHQRESMVRTQSVTMGKKKRLTHVASRYMRGAGFILWHGRHELLHVLLGLMWAWFVREKLGELNWRWIGVAVFGSLLPDGDHLIYFLIYGRKDAYSKLIRKLFRSREWRMLTVTLETNHKSNVHLATHNLAVIGFLVLLVFASYFFEWQTALVLVGAMVTHYLFDVVDDLLVLGSLNPNWKRLGRGRKLNKQINK